MAASVEIVELRFVDRVVDVDGREQQLTVLLRWYSRCTPVVVSSVTPRIPLAMPVQYVSPALGVRRSISRHTRIPRPSAWSVDGTAAGFLELDALVDEHGGIATVVEDHVGPSPSGQRSTCSVHHQYSSSVSPFQANTGTPLGLSGVPSGPTAMAAAA